MKLYSILYAVACFQILSAQNLELIVDGKYHLTTENIPYSLVIQRPKISPEDLPRTRDIFSRNRNGDFTSLRVATKRFPGKTRLGPYKFRLGDSEVVSNSVDIEMIETPRTGVFILCNKDQVKINEPFTVSVGSWDDVSIDETKVSEISAIKVIGRRGIMKNRLSIKQFTLTAKQVGEFTITTSIFEPSFEDAVILGPQSVKVMEFAFP